jgi:hypothetical protein
MHRPITMLINAAQTFPLMLPSNVNGNTIVTTVTRPTIQPKKIRGRGVTTESRCASPVASRAATNAVIA